MINRIKTHVLSNYSFTICKTQAYDRFGRIMLKEYLFNYKTSKLRLKICLCALLKMFMPC